MPKKKVSFLDYGPVNGARPDNGTRKADEECSTWCEIIGGLPTILITPMGMLVGFVLAQGNTAMTFVWWAILVVSSLIAARKIGAM